MSTGCNPGELFKEFEKPILRHLRRKTPDDASAEDLASELWVRVVDYADKFDGNKGSVKAWLYTIADNLISDFWDETLLPKNEDGIPRKRTERLNHLRKSDREILGNRGIGKDPDAENAPEYDTVDRCPSPEEWLIALEQDESVDVILRQIDTPSRVVLKSRLQGMSLNEIAEKTNTPLSAVKARLYRGQAKARMCRDESNARRGNYEPRIKCGSVECRRAHWFPYSEAQTNLEAKW